MEHGPKEFANDIDVSRETLERLQAYADLLRKWQSAKNLVANSTLDDMWRRHFLDSAQMYAHIRSVIGDQKVDAIDIGSGAGFPGLVLSIMGLGHFSMVESNGKKCSFMRQVARATGASADILQERIESLVPRETDIITSRACATIDKLLTWGAPFCGQNTEFWLLKGENVDKELTEAEKTWNIKTERFDSLTSSGGCVLRLYDISRR